ncbi:SOS response-associated peptidase [soil metagenome]
MCYNVEYIEGRVEKYKQRYPDIIPPDWNDGGLFDVVTPYYFVSGFSHPKLPIVKSDGVFLYEWGLIPLWAKDITIANDIRNKTLNAVGETVFEKPSFRKSIVNKRCLLGINGFYEWRDFNGRKYPYHIRAKGDELFSLGCIYENWVDKSTGEIRDTFSILTTPANPMMEKIHNIKKRMPLIISRNDESKWVDPKLSTENIQSLIKPYPESEMEAYTISTDANSARKNRNTPEILAPVTYSELN